MTFGPRKLVYGIRIRLAKSPEREPVKRSQRHCAEIGYTGEGPAELKVVPQLGCRGTRQAARISSSPKVRPAMTSASDFATAANTSGSDTHSSQFSSPQAGGSMTISDSVRARGVSARRHELPGQWLRSGSPSRIRGLLQTPSGSDRDNRPRCLVRDLDRIAGRSTINEGH
jgi:hypothetical protein